MQSTSYIHRDDLSMDELKELEQIFRDQLGIEAPKIVCAGDIELPEHIKANIAAEEERMTERALDGLCGYCDKRFLSINEATGEEIVNAGWRLFENEPGDLLILMCPEHCNAMQLEQRSDNFEMYTGMSLN